MSALLCTALLPGSISVPAAPGGGGKGRCLGSLNFIPLKQPGKESQRRSLALLTCCPQGFPWRGEAVISWITGWRWECQGRGRPAAVPRTESSPGGGGRGPERDCSTQRTAEGTGARAQLAQRQRGEGSDLRDALLGGRPCPRCLRDIPFAPHDPEVRGRKQPGSLGGHAQGQTAGR